MKGLSKLEKVIMIVITVGSMLIGVLSEYNLIITVLESLSTFFIGMFWFVMFVNRKRLKTYEANSRLSILLILYGITAIAGEVLTSGKLVTIINGIILAMVVMATVLLIKGNEKYREEVDQIKFGYVWLAGVLMIPFIVIGVLLGY